MITSDFKFIDRKTWRHVELPGYGRLIPNSRNEWIKGKYEALVTIKSGTEFIFKHPIKG